VSAVGRGVVTITATAAGGASGTTTVTVTAIRIGRLFAGLAPKLPVHVPTDLQGLIYNFPDAVTFNNMTPAQLRAAYDVLLFPYTTNVANDATWTTRLLPYLSLGGGIVTEDYTDTLSTEFGAVATGGWTSGVYPCTSNCDVSQMCRVSRWPRALSSRMTSTASH